MKEFSWENLFEVVLWLLLLFLIIYYFFTFEKGVLANILAAVGIISTLIIFRANVFWDRKKQKQKQVSMIKNILNEIDILLEDRIVCGVKIEGHITWFAKELENSAIPLHPIKEINVANYVTSLDHKVSKKETYELKQSLQLINDKIFLVNSYVKRLLDAEYSDLDEKIKTKIRQNFIPKLKLTVTDLKCLAVCVKIMIKERWNIKSS